MKNSSGLKAAAVILAIAVALTLSIVPLVDNINLGLDLQGGAQVVLRAVPDDDNSVNNEDMNQLVSVLDKRINELGVSEPVIQIEGTDRIIVELAGVDDPDAAIKLIGTTAKLEFVDPNGNVILTGSDLDDAYPTTDPNESPNKRNQVALEFNKEGSKKFFDATAAWTGSIIRIQLDGKDISTPEVSGPISGGNAVISGGFETFADASNLAALLRGGSLPLNLEILSKRTVGPTLGADSLAKSLNASAIGFIILFLFVIAYYRLPGIWACISLVVYTLILLWLFYLIDATLTLTSIAGFILSVGMAVDSNIIIYERIREEMFHGKSIKASIESGFNRAFWTIFDSNLTTLIAAVVLYYFGTGTIRGFALTLTLGIFTSMFTAIVFTRLMLRWMSDIDFLAKKKFYGI